MSIGSDVANTTRPNRKGSDDDKKERRKMLTVTIEQLKQKRDKKKSGYSK